MSGVEKASELRKVHCVCIVIVGRHQNEDVIMQIEHSINWNEMK